MPRAKGSKNKAKHPETEEKKKPVGHSLSVTDTYTPTPDMGDIKEPSKSLAPCDCGHAKGKHYGPSVNWCNEAGCQCQNFNEK